MGGGTRHRAVAAALAMLALAACESEELAACQRGCDELHASAGDHCEEPARTECEALLRESRRGCRARCAEVDRGR
jgi:hypothetical protein